MTQTYTPIHDIQRVKLKANLGRGLATGTTTVAIVDSTHHLWAYDADGEPRLLMPGSYEAATLPEQLEMEL